MKLSEKEKDMKKAEKKILKKYQKVITKGRAFDQVAGERDIAVQQLRMLGYQLGEKIDEKDMKYRVCEICEGSGLVEIENGKRSSCLNCNGEGFIPVFRVQSI